MQIRRRTNKTDHMVVQDKPIIELSYGTVTIRVNARGGECANHDNRVEIPYSEFKQIVKTAIKQWFKSKFKTVARTLVTRRL